MHVNPFTTSGTLSFGGTFEHAAHIAKYIKEIFSSNSEANASDTGTLVWLREFFSIIVVTIFLHDTCVRD